MIGAVLDVDAAPPRGGSQQEYRVLPSRLVVGGGADVDLQAVALAPRDELHTAVLPAPSHDSSCSDADVRLGMIGGNCARRHLELCQLKVSCASTERGWR